MPEVPQLHQSKDQTFCPKCGWMYCPGYWNEGVCLSDMHFCGEPTADGDACAQYLRVWYEKHHESWWDRRKKRWEWAADNLMLGMINEIGRIQAEYEKQKSKYCQKDNSWHGQTNSRH